MGVFSYHRFMFPLACIDRWKVYEGLVFECTVKTVIEVKCLCVSTSKKRHSCRAFSSLTDFLFVCATIKLVNLAFRTTIIEDTSSYSIQSRGKQLFNFLPLQTYEKKIAEFPLLFIFIIPCSVSS